MNMLDVTETNNISGRLIIISKNIKGHPKKCYSLQTSLYLHSLLNVNSREAFTLRVTVAT